MPTAPLAFGEDELDTLWVTLGVMAWKGTFKLDSFCYYFFFEWFLLLLRLTFLRLGVEGLDSPIQKDTSLEINRNRRVECTERLNVEEPGGFKSQCPADP